MKDYDKLLNNMKKLLDSLDEPAFIVINIGEACMYAENQLMTKEEQQFKSTCYHCANLALANKLYNK